MKKKQPASFISNLPYFDWLLIMIITILVFLSCLLLLNATADAFTEETVTLSTIFSHLHPRATLMQLVWFAIGLALMFVLLLFDYSIYYDYAWYLYGFSLLLLILVLIFGKVVSGSKSWFRITPTIGFQPSEVSKIPLILILSRVICRHEKLRRPRDILLVLALFLVPVILIYRQPDYGTIMVYMAILIGLMIAARLDWRYALIGVTGFCAAIPLFWNKLLSNYQKERILTFLDPTRDTTGAGLQVAKSKIAIGSGQLFGKGFFRSGSLAQLDYVPEKTNDFIFSVAGEAMGFVGCVLVILLLTLLVLRILQQAYRARDRFGMLVCVGISSMMIFHIVESLGMTIGLMPVTGIPLPFVSAGGSNMLTNMIAAALVMNVGMRRNLQPPHGADDGDVYKGLYRP